MDNLSWLQQLHFIRPYWLLAIFPLVAGIWLYARIQSNSRSWAAVIDKKLLPHLLQGDNLSKKSTPVKTLFILGLIVIFSLAGPAFEKRPQAVFKAQSALVIILDLSRSMDATDIKPSRLSRAHFKINDILKLRKEGQTALIVYAANAYTVSPLTEDAQTITSQIAALETHIMPAQGSRLDIALDMALQLFTNAGHSKGDIIVITDSINTTDSKKLKELKSKNFETSILAIGTEEGAPIASQNGGFVKDNNGSIVVPKLDINTLKNAALSSGGKFSLITANDKDINHILSAIDINRHDTKEEQPDEKAHKFKTDAWYEEGPWLLLLIIPFAAYSFRKGLIFALLIFILPMPQPAYAFEWSDLWKNQNQRGEIALEKGDAKRAADLFNNSQWKAAAQYKAGEYQKSAELLKDIDNADANYNRGNALAKAGDMQAAIKAYDRTLEINPDHEDAKYNKQLLEKAQQEQENQQPKSDSQDNTGDEQSDDQKDGQNSDKQDSSSDSQSGSNEQNKQQSANDSDQQQNNNSDAQNQSRNEGKESEQQNQPENKSENDTSAAEKDEEKSASESNSEKQPDNESSDEKQNSQQNFNDASPDLEQQQTQQWLKKIPDDPGGLLRRKFKYQYSREQNQNENNPW
ncbi:MAG: VWA domain-containing protein [Gammaproteobacteria bacterium]|nr:VWA domain-containing protein [Gammaproteobacteria bacterium]